MKYSVRAVILKENELLLVRNNLEGGAVSDFLCLPGGRVEQGESLEDALKREIVEELGVEPEIGEMLFVNQWKLNPEGVAAPDFIFLINNPQDFVSADFSKASHAFELKEARFVSFDTKEKILPKWLPEELKNNRTKSSLKYISDED